MSKLTFNKEQSTARLKEIMMVPVMSAEGHALILRARIGHLRTVENGREQVQHRRADAYCFS